MGPAPLRQQSVIKPELDSDIKPRELGAMLIAGATYKQSGVTGTQAGMNGSSIIPLGLAMCIIFAAACIGTASAGEPSTSAAAIVVTFPITAPDSTEQDVAAQYRLEPIEQRTSQVLARRIVVYRIPAGRTQADVLKQIGADARISSAQPNFEYMAPMDQPPDPVVAGGPPAQTPSGKTGRRATVTAGKPESHRGRASSPRVALARENTPRASLPREEPASTSQRSRISSLGGNLAWPTADEPFVGTPRGSR